MINIAAFFAHPDDCELWACGTLKKHIERGDVVNTYLFYELNKCRLKESSQALLFLRIPPFYFKTNPFTLPEFKDFCDNYTFEPDIIITHWEHDTHLEHKLIFNFSLLFAHYLKRYKKKTPIILMSSTYNQVGNSCVFIPTVIVDISDQWENKKKAIMLQIGRAHV